MAQLVAPVFSGSNPVRALASGLVGKRGAVVDVVIPSYREPLGIVRNVERAVAESRFGRPVVVEGVGDKGTALALGLDLVTTDRVAFLDSDLVGLRPEHVDQLLGQDPAAMTIGLVSGPSLVSGERILPTWLARAAGLAGTGYGAKGRLFRAAVRYDVPIRYVSLEGVHHRTTREKGRPWTHHARRWAQVARGFAGPL